jgi:class 3 adenylate cyclase
MPPWFRTWWAYVLYLAAAVAAVWGLFHWRLRRLEESNRRLEALVDERTAEVRRQRDEIRAHERKTEALLLNILPAQVAAELRETGAVVPMGFDNVTVCMTDFKGFTLSSESLPPRELIDALNDYFTAFDEVIAKYGLERLKTIGDAYMFAAGLPRASKSHAVDAALAATEIARIVEANHGKRAGISWKIRIGLNSGPVVAGVVGIQKFAFDIWGNTVNLASRMESSGAVGCVNVSTRTYAEIRDFIDCEPRGLVHTKDGRDLEMYFVRGVREELLAGDSGPIPAAFARLYQERFGAAPPSFPARAGSAEAL